MKTEFKQEEKLTAIDPFAAKFVIREWNRPKTIAKLIEMCETISKEWEGEIPVDRGEKGSLSGVQTNLANVFEMEDRFPVMTDVKKMFQQMVFDYFKANSNFKQPTSYELQGWFNRMRDNSFHPPHSHGDVDLVINLYLTTPTGEDMHGRPIPSRVVFVAETAMQNCKTYIGEKANAQFYPKVGEMLASPPWLIHWVPPTHSKEWRRSLSVNVVGLTYEDK